MPTQLRIIAANSTAPMSGHRVAQGKEKLAMWCEPASGTGRSPPVRECEPARGGGEASG
jgi:hypothetical protein